ncbi:MAG: substrate-binding domain-containing protein [Thermoleophilia bacterium]|nr:substrate-binding domain-containing protein [Thermoleophilia bacterium]
MTRAMHKRSLLVLAVLALLLLAALPVLAGCGSDSGEGEPAEEPQEQSVARDQLIVATTTSLNDSGLFEDVVLPAYAEIAPDVTVKVVAVGSGEAIAMAERGEADVLTVHSPAAEQEFMDAGYGTLRLQFAYNYFIIVGPESDPAGVAETATAAESFAAIADSGSVFVSRGDESGTHSKELKIWEGAGIEPSGDRYLSTGQGMGETLRIASEKQGYTLTDTGTYLAQRDTLDLVPLSPESDDLQNTYSVILIDQNLHTAINAAAAERLAQYLVSKEGQDAIAAYGEEEFGEPLFRPYAQTLGSY